MNKADLINSIVNNTNLTKSECEKVINSALEIIKQTTKSGEDITLVGFGTFTQIKKKARSGRNPLNGKIIQIPETNSPKFRPAKHFKELIN